MDKLRHSVVCLLQDNNDTTIFSSCFMKDNNSCAEITASMQTMNHNAQYIQLVLLIKLDIITKFVSNSYLVESHT